MQFAQSFSPLKDKTGVEATDYSSDFEIMFDKLDKLEKHYENGSMDFNLIRYLPGRAKILCQGQISDLSTKRKYADPNYTDMNTLELNVVLSANKYTKFGSIHLFSAYKNKIKRQ